uniref:DNA-directed RNA polymerase subunit alpha n=1 Tax=Porphyridium sordidum TaxID=28024 RepID=A0A1C9CE07_PORSO|nr:DNA-directed RNA polymerase alpha subunit [Porphyridium sordidum]AOM66628.1 DNA-directed RNA polymerase alpha subunit [Porphyridium sordidum]
MECVESQTIGPRNIYGKFHIDNLKPGQGVTIGNALRRTILSNLSGKAIVGVRISGINHEFSILPGVREDVLEILLNLKDVVFKGNNSETSIGRLKIQGPAIITSGVFDLPTGVEVVDPCQYIATISTNTIVDMEFRIETGSGYRLADKANVDNLVDFLKVDAVFMPVRKVNYQIDEIIAGDKLFDRLIFEIWTNGSILPTEAISDAAEILTNLFNPLRDIVVKNNDLLTTTKDEKKINQVLIEELQLSVRAYNCLKRAKIHSIADLLNYSQEELLEIKNFGQKSAEEVIEALQKRLGINLPTEKI